MKTFIVISALILLSPCATAQQTTANGVLFKNPGTQEQIKIEAGNKVRVWFRIPDVSVIGLVLSCSDSALTMKVANEHNQRVVPLRIIAKMAVEIGRPKKFVVWVTMQDGKILKGDLIRTTPDSLSLFSKRNRQEFTIGASRIKQIRIRNKRAIGKGITIGSCTGAVVGGIIGYASYSPVQDDWLGLNDLGYFICTVGGALIGAAAGVLTGTVIGVASGKLFKIEGQPARFESFAFEFKDQGLRRAPRVVKTKIIERVNF